MAPVTNQLSHCPVTLEIELFDQPTQAEIPLFSKFEGIVLLWEKKIDTRLFMFPLTPKEQKAADCSKPHPI